MDRLWLKVAEVRAKVPAGVHYVAAPVLVINLFAASLCAGLFFVAGFLLAKWEQ